ncbi:hypothetical protein BXA19_11740, partial [Corynebacterium diphtheriae]
IQGSGSDAISEPDPCKDPNRLELTQSGKRGSVQPGGIKVKHRFSQTWQRHEQQRIRTRRNQSA